MKITIETDEGEVIVRECKALMCAIEDEESYRSWIYGSGMDSMNLYAYLSARLVDSATELGLSRDAAIMIAAMFSASGIRADEERGKTDDSIRALAESLGVEMPDA